MKTNFLTSEKWKSNGYQQQSTKKMSEELNKLMALVRGVAEDARRALAEKAAQDAQEAKKAAHDAQEAKKAAQEAADVEKAKMWAEKIFVGHAEAKAMEGIKRANARRIAHHVMIKVALMKGVPVYEVARDDVWGINYDSCLLDRKTAEKLVKEMQGCNWGVHTPPRFFVRVW